MSKESDFSALLFSGSSNLELAREIGECLGVSLGKIAIERFPDGETFVQILENVRGRDVFIVETVALDPNNYLMELLIIVDALKRASALSITAVIPYFGYCRQDRKDKPRVPITAKLVANLLECAGVSRILTVDLHAGQLQGFFDIPVDNVLARPIFIDALQKFECRDLVVVAPDIGSVKVARNYARYFKVGMAVVDKVRINAIEVEDAAFIGNVEGKDVLLADDMCSTGGTLVSAAKACHEKGAHRVFGVVTHGLFVDHAIEKIEQSPIEALLMSNTIFPAEHICRCARIRVLSIAPLLAQAIRCIISKESLSSLYQI